MSSARKRLIIKLYFIRGGLAYDLQIISKSFAVGAGAGMHAAALEYLLKQKAAGRIRHLGFSAHGSYDVMKRFLDAYGEHMEFGQIQLNYVDWSFQDAKAKVELLQSHQIPVWVMEPLRGGKLARLSESDEAALKALRPEEKRPSACIGCRSCEAVCPQQIKISESMADFSQKLGA